MDPSSAPLLPGLVSISFRAHSAETVIKKSAAAGIAGIEWGGDIHVPHGNLTTAARIGTKTRDAGLAVSAYGSYYRAGHDVDLRAADVVATAAKLGAPIIRIWTGKVGSDEASDDYRIKVAADCRHISTLAADVGIKIATEWHGNTLTDTATSATQLFESVDHSNFFTFWQPRVKTPVEACLIDLQAALPRLIGVHVFHWNVSTRDRLRLAQGTADWAQYLAHIPRTPGMFASLEFLPDDNIDLLPQETATLKHWLQG